MPELQFFFDESVEKLDRVERILQEIQAERATAAPGDHGATAPDAVPSTSADSLPDATPNATPNATNERDDDR